MTEEPVLPQRDVRMLEAISRMAYSNPFSPERIRNEREILGRKFVEVDAVAWGRRHGAAANDRPNVVALTQVTAGVVDRVRKALDTGARPPQQVLEWYWDAATYLLLYRHVTTVPVTEWAASPDGKSSRISQSWREFAEDHRELLEVPVVTAVMPGDAAHLFACLCQIHRAFFNIFDHILGESLPVAELRARVWESIFSSDMGRYYRGLWSQMRSVATLISGPSGTGKELVARAIGLSGYLPFQRASGRFLHSGSRPFSPINLTALSRTLVESELFGHRRGAFTGALADRKGWLETCGSSGAVFLDEIGELDGDLQVKLLRVVQQRTYSRIGDSEERRFEGKLIAATNRDLLAEIRLKRFREDLYFRLCADRIETPSLRQQLDDRPDDLRFLVQGIADRILPAESAALSGEVLAWIQQHLGSDYPWSGNIRELEQCVWNIVVHRNYVPVLQAAGGGPAVPAWLQLAAERKLSADQLVQHYCVWVHAASGTYEKAAALLGLDRRTVKAKIEESRAAAPEHDAPPS